ncbi:hypothetical protein V6Z11_1Z012100 [Gossypium hirsutum]
MEKRETRAWQWAIDKDKGSQHALKWAVDHLISRGQSITLLHVKTKPSSIPTPSGSHVKMSDVNDEVAKAYKQQLESQAKEVFLPFRCFCSRKDIKCNEVILEDTDISKALIDYVSSFPVETLVLGAPSRSALRFRTAEVTTNVSKGAPDYCTIYVIGKGKISSSQPLLQPQTDNNIPDPTESPSSARAVVNPRHRAPQRPHNPHRNLHEEAEIKSPFTRARNVMKYEPPTPESDISFDDVEAEMRRLKQELKQTMDMYSAACKEALSAKKKAMELQSWKMQEEQKKEEARVAEEAALSLAETEKAKCNAAIEEAQEAQRIAELEAKKSTNIERKANIDDADDDDMNMALNGFGHHLMYRKYTIEEIEIATDNFSPSRKIGEGGYGPVYHSNLDHTPVAIKVLRPDATQGQSQFQQEVEVLSCIRHPNMVLLLGACPEYGCLVYEYMANGSLEDRLFMHNNSPVLPWQIRFRIAAEIATGLLFLHHTKPKPLVHRDLKPANILLDHNYVSKISDVGLARLYRMTSAAGTFCYIDPEYQQTGMLGIKSDTPAVTDWPLEEALSFAKLALKCAELRRRDRPDLGQVVLPHLNKLRDLAESNMPFMT